MKAPPLFVLALASHILLSLTSLEAATFGDFTYRDNGANITITDYPQAAAGVNGTLQIPATIIGKPVVEIGLLAFSGCVGLRQVIVPEGVIKLGSSSFSNCDGLSSITIPSTVNEIGSGAFSSCQSLPSIIIPSAVTVINSSTFSSCTILSSVTLSPNTGSIGSSAFSSCNLLSTINMPPGLFSIGSNAFSYCDSLVNISLPNGLTSLGSSAFSNCANLQSVSLPGSLAVIGDSAFSSCSSLTDISLAQGIVSIGGWAFYDCDALSSVSIPASVTNIQDLAFYHCNTLQTARFIGNAPLLGSSVFSYAATGFSVEFYSGASGFTTPLWNGYPSRVLILEVDVEQPSGNPLQNGISLVDFGSADMGAIATQLTFVIKNSGTTDLENISVTVAGADALSFVVGSLPSVTLAPGNSQSFNVTFNPQVVGSLSATLSITSNDPDENPFVINLGGIGLVPPAPEVVVQHPTGVNLADGTAVLEFGESSIGIPLTETITIRNAGTANLTNLNVILSGANVSDFAAGALGATTLSPGEETSFIVTFTPTEGAHRVATLQIASNDADENPFDITLAGMGPPAPDIAIHYPTGTNLVDGSASLAFGNSNIGTSIVQTVTVYNTGTANLTGLVVSRSGTNAADFTLSALGATSLAPGVNTTFAVTFTPSVTGTRSAALQIASNDADENPFDISLGGMGVMLPEIVVEQPAGSDLVDGTAAMTFGNSNIGASVVQTVTVRNTGIASLAGLAVTRNGINAADFVLGALGATSLSPGASTTFTVAFTPSSAGTRSAALQITSNDADENPFDITLGGTGVIPPAPEIVVEEPAETNLVDGTGALSFGYYTNIGTVVTKTVTVRNTGTANLTGLAVTLSGTNVTDFALGALGSTTLAPGANTTFAVTFSPLSAGSRSAALQIASNDADENPFDITLGGSGVVPPAAEIVVQQPAGTNLADGTAALAFAYSDIGTAITKTITVRNTGTANLTGIAASLSGTDAVDFVLGSLGSTTLAPGANTTFTVTFSPSVAGSRSAVLQIASNDADENPFDIALSGSGLAPLTPEIVVQQPVGTDLLDGAASLAFGNSNIGTPVIQTVMVRNTGMAYLTGLVVTSSGINSENFSLGYLGATSLAPGANTTFTVTFTPSNAGSHSAMIQIASNDADENPFDITLGGTGVAAPEVVVEQPAGTSLMDGEATLAFGNSNIGESVVHTVRVLNTGTANLTGLKVTRSGANATDFVFGALESTSLIPGDYTNFTVTFRPSATGTRSAALQIVSNDADENPFDITLSGNGLLPTKPEIDVKDSSGVGLVDGVSDVAFGNSSIGAPVTKVITVLNTGTANLNGLSVTRSGVNISEFAVGILGSSTLAPGASTTFTVTFTPTVAGTRAAKLHIASNDADENPFDITLTGTGIAPEISVKDPSGNDLTDGVSSIGFGRLIVGTTVTKSFTIKNAGKAILKNLSIAKNGTNANEFIVIQPLKNSLAPGASSTFIVKFKPLFVGKRNAAIHIVSNDGNENPFDILLFGVGLAPEIAIKSPSGSNLTDGISSINAGSLKVKSSALLSFTIKNVGTANLTNLSIKKNGANAEDFRITQPLKTILVAGSSTTFSVKFTPSATGTRTAAIHITSNDSNENPFDIKLKGTGLVKKLAPLTLAGFSDIDSVLSRASSDEMKYTPETTTFMTWLDGHKYLALAVRKPAGDLDFSHHVEVSSDLIIWHSGDDHTTVLENDGVWLKVRDNTPLKPDAKRYIRLK